MAGKKGGSAAAQKTGPQKTAPQAAQLKESPKYPENKPSMTGGKSGKRRTNNGE